jgi:hypothetical protein
MGRLSTVHFACLTLAAGAAIPFGLFGMGGRKLVDPYTSGMQQAQPETILQDLAAARARGARMVVNFAGGSAKFTDAEGHFDYKMWKARVDRFLPIADQLNAYVPDRTLLAFMIIDEPFAKKRWGGQTVPLATLDQMGGYSKSLFPDLPTAVRAAPSELQNYQWRYLEASWAQYTSKKGPIAEYVSTEVAAARAEELGLIVGLNISKGGDGSSGFGSANESSMSGAEILRYGHALLDEPYACAFISWDSRPSVINRPDVAAALKELALAAQAHPETSCRQKKGDRRSSQESPGPERLP